MTVQEIWRCLREKQIDKKYERLVNEMYSSVKTEVRSRVGMTNSFGVEVNLHQGTALT